MKNKILVVLGILQLLAVIGIVFYFAGYKRYGSPAKFKEEQLALRQARQDSIDAAERNKVLAENMADSTLFAVSRHTDLFREIERSDAQLQAVKTSLDSLEQEKMMIAAKEQEIDMKLRNLEEASNLAEEKNYTKLASLYDNMKAPQAVPLFVAMDDTTAVAIISLMTERNASRLLGALAGADIEKAARINKMLAEMGN